MNDRIITIQLTSGRELDAMVPYASFGAMFSSAIQQGMPLIEVPTITGHATIVMHQVVAWWPKASGSSRPAQHQSISGADGRKNARKR